jgi:hypothetical protein
VLKRQASDELRTYVVWVPKFRATDEHVAVAARYVPDTRATHFWDAHEVLVRGFRAALNLSEDAWDVYLLYGREARWVTPLPPPPSYWMHQLGTPDAPRVSAPYLNVDLLAERVDTALARRAAWQRPVISLGSTIAVRARAMPIDLPVQR